VVGCGGIATLMFPSVPVLVAPLTWGVAGLGMGIAFSTLSLVVLEEAPKGAEGAATAGIQLMNVLGSALGTGVGGALVARTDAAGVGVGRGILQQDIVMVAVLVVALLTAQRLPGRPNVPADDGAAMPVAQMGSGD
jgi:MFS family permease